MFFKIIVVLAAASFCSAKVYQDCGSQGGSFVSLTLNDCDVENAKYCTVYKGESINIEISFKNITASKVIVNAKTEDEDSPGPNSFVLKDAEGCSGYGFICPLEAAQTYTFKATIPVTGIHRGSLHWDLDGEKGKDLICLHIQLWTEVRDPEE